MSNFFKRILSGAIYVTIFIFAVLFAKESYIALITIFAAISIWELSKIVDKKSILPYLILTFLSTYTYLKLPSFQETWILLILSLFCLVRLLIDLFSSGFKERNNFAKVSIQIEYVVFPFFFLMLLPFIDSIYHPNIIIYIIVIIWTNDSFAFLVGKNFGKRKLFERISPKKTVEGFIGGLLFSIITGVVIGLYSNEFSIANWIVIAIIISIFGNLGDLVESKFKRQANVKDSGTIMPGHGGILDRLDSLFFLAPFVYLYIHFLL